MEAENLAWARHSFGLFDCLVGATRIVATAWKPAQTFWDAFQFYDPAAIIDVRLRTEAALTALGDRTKQLKATQPTSPMEYGEKVRAALALALVKTAYAEHQSAAPAGSKRLLGKLIASGPESLILDPVTGALAYWVAPEEGGWDESNVLNCELLAISLWSDVLLDDFRRLWG